MRVAETAERLRYIQKLGTAYQCTRSERDGEGTSNSPDHSSPRRHLYGAATSAGCGDLCGSPAHSSERSYGIPPGCRRRTQYAAPEDSRARIHNHLDPGPSISHSRNQRPARYDLPEPAKNGKREKETRHARDAALLGRARRVGEAARPRALPSP